MPTSDGRFRGINVPDVPWHRVSWTQTVNEDGTFTRVYHQSSGDQTVILDPKAKDKTT